MKTKIFIKKLPLALAFLLITFSNFNLVKAEATYAGLRKNAGYNAVGNQKARHQEAFEYEGIASETANGLSDPNSDLSITMATLIMAIGTIAVALYRFNSKEHEMS